MPRFDGTGPRGMGPMSGKGMGPCRGRGFRRCFECWQDWTQDLSEKEHDAALKMYKKRLMEELAEVEKELKNG